MSKLILDYNFAAKSNLDCGISQIELDKQYSKAQKGFDKLKKMMKDGKVGFADLPYQNLDSIKKLVKEVQLQFNDLVVVGIGGSALGLEAVYNALLVHEHNGLSFADRKNMPRHWIMDNVDPLKISSVFEYCKQEDTFVIVISKSGSTVETAANFALIYDWLSKGVTDIKKHLAVITDPEKGPLRELVNEKKLFSLPIESNVGGRFSVLSSAGLLPAAILDINIEDMLKGAAKIVESDFRQVLTAAAIYMHFMEKGKSINVLMPYSSKLVKFAEWFAQLWGESLGKRYNEKGEEIFFGTTPLRTSGAIDQHSQLQLFREGPDDKFYTFIGVNSHHKDKQLNGNFNKAFNYLNGHTMGELMNVELGATEVALRISGRPSMRIEIDKINTNTLGQLFMFYQYVVAIIGLANDIDPFDQPGVEEGKNFAYGILGKDGYSAKKDEYNKLHIKDVKYII